MRRYRGARIVVAGRYFNPRTREGCDQALTPIGCITINISIHAPVKGATGRPERDAQCFYDFNPRTREGCDDGRTADDVAPYIISIHAPVKGATYMTGIMAARVDISIHAPVKGATGDAVDKPILQAISIHAPVKGATLAGLHNIPGKPYFNPRTREGCDFVELDAAQIPRSISIHAPVKGATMLESVAWPALYAISIHAPVKGAT